MLIVGFGKTFTVHDQAPKKLIMRTLARAAMETDKALEEEDMYWLKGETGPQAPTKVSGTGTMMRVHASPSLNKRADGSESCEMSPRRAAAGGQRSPQSNTVQDTDDRIPKENVYGTIRPKAVKQPVTETEDVDCLPPPPQEGYEETRPQCWLLRRLLLAWFTVRKVWMLTLLEAIEVLTPVFLIRVPQHPPHLHRDKQ